MLNKIVKIFPGYLMFLFPSLVIGMLVWSIFVTGKLYYCSDSVPLLDFIPPFVHPRYGDYYIASPIVVWGIWVLLFGLMIVIPHVLAKRIYKN